MKKLFVTLLFVFGIGFANGNNDANTADAFGSCWMYALDSAEQEGAYYGYEDPLQYEEAFNWYLEICEEAGVDTMGDPVFL